MHAPVSLQVMRFAVAEAARQMGLAEQVPLPGALPDEIPLPGAVEVQHDFMRRRSTTRPSGHPPHGKKHRGR